MQRTTCLLCGAPLTFCGDFQAHPVMEDCTVRYTDAWGVAIDRPPTSPENGQISVAAYPFVEDVLGEVFAASGLERLGGASTGRGWSSFSTFQRCPLLWKRKYIEKRKPALLMESPSLAVGTLVHAFLAAHYTRQMDPGYPLGPDELFQVVRAKADPKFVEESWRIYRAYALYYTSEEIQPIAIEYDLKDPRTGESCRYDLVAFFPEPVAGRPAGTYIVEHKTAGRFDADTIDGWVNDGEIIGEVALWKKLGLDHRFGTLQGILVNIIGKQKDPQFHRTFISPESWQVDAHLDDLRRWEGLITLAQATDNFPRARSGCVTRYGRCTYWDACATGEL